MSSRGSIRLSREKNSLQKVLFLLNIIIFIKKPLKVTAAPSLALISVQQPVGLTVERFKRVILGSTPVVEE